jgi:hypothetical protein
LTTVQLEGSNAVKVVSASVAYKVGESADDQERPWSDQVGELAG